MQISILGAGKMGTALAQAWAMAGHRVTVTSTRDPSAMAALVSQLDSRVNAMDNLSAVRHSDVVVLAVPWIALKQVTSDASRFAEKIVIDAMNAFGAYPRLLDLGDDSSSEIVASRLPRAYVVKALNTVQARDIVHRGRPGGSLCRVGIPIYGNAAAAKRVTADLIGQIGFDAVDLGSLSNSRFSEPYGPLFGRNYTAAEIADLLPHLICLPAVSRGPIFT